MTDSLFPVLLILRYMHILGAIALMGSTIFMRFALRPASGSLPPEAAATLHAEVRRRWAKFVMLATLLILVSGLANLRLASRYDYEPVLGLAKGYHLVVGIKFLLALPIFFIAAILMGKTNLAKRFQAQAELWMNINLTLALVMVLMGGLLKFVVRTPKNAATPPAAVTAVFDPFLGSPVFSWQAAREPLD